MRTRRTLQITLMSLLFGLSFMLFLFLTFPYEVLKEAVAAQISKATGYNVQIGDMSAALPLGVKAEDIRVDSPNGSASLEIKGLKARVSVLGLFAGQLGLSLDASAGNLSVSVNFSIFDLVGGNPAPKRLNIEAKNFPLDGLVSFALNLAASSPTANPMVAPLLSAVGLSALLNGSADFKLDAKNPIQSTGNADLHLTNAVLKLSHPSLGLPDQVFKKALIKAKVENGSVVIDRSSGFIAEELELLADGKVMLRSQPGASQLDMKIIFRLNAGLKEKFGFLIDAMTGSATSEGRLTMQVRGSLDEPAVTTF